MFDLSDVLIAQYAWQVLFQRARTTNSIPARTEIRSYNTKKLHVKIHILTLRYSTQHSTKNVRTGTKACYRKTILSQICIIKQTFLRSRQN